MHKYEHQLLKMANIRTSEVSQGNMDHFIKNQESIHLSSDKGHLKEWSLKVYIQTCKICPSLSRQSMKSKESTTQTCKSAWPFSNQST